MVGLKHSEIKKFFFYLIFYTLELLFPAGQKDPVKNQYFNPLYCTRVQYHFFNNVTAPPRTGVLDKGIGKARECRLTFLFVWKPIEVQIQNLTLMTTSQPNCYAVPKFMFFSSLASSTVNLEESG